jgi:RNA polymerase sigma factor (sigma-70 family)
MTPKDAIELAKTGSQKAFTLLYNTHYKAVYNSVFNIVKNRDVADDLTSETFLKAFKNIEKFTRDISFEMWLKTIANHHSIDFIRSGKRSQNNLYIDDEDSSEFIHTDNSNPEKDLIKKEEDINLEKALSRLSSRAREVLTYRFRDELTYQEIADKLGLSIGTIKHYIHRYKSKIIKFINQKVTENETNKSIVFGRTKPPS